MLQGRNEVLAQEIGAIVRRNRMGLVHQVIAALMASAIIGLPAKSAVQPVPPKWEAVVRIQVDSCIPGSGGSGTGFIISSAGLVLTAKHVVSPPGRIKGKPCQYSVLGTGFAGSRRAHIVRQSDGPDADAALLQIEKVPEGGLKALALGSARELPVATPVISIGYDRGDTTPQEHLGKLTSPVDKSRGIAKVDALFTKGSSGGPILMDGCDVVIGLAKSGFSNEPGQLRIITIDPILDGLALRGDSAIEKVGLPCRPWPEGAVQNGRAVVTATDAERTIPYLRLPSGFTLVADPSVSQIKWRVQLLEYGDNVTLDLSAPNTPPLTPPPGSPRPDNKPWGADGDDGVPGTEGVRGRSGIEFNMEVTSTIGAGILWVRTDGGPGGSGGAGGNGQAGGNSSCGKLWDERRTNGHTNGGNGGKGGPGGPGGMGGATSRVVIRGAENTLLPCPAATAPSARPSLTRPGIYVYGAPGQGGAGGAGGTGGHGGSEGDKTECNGTDRPQRWVLYTVSGGNPGEPGVPGHPGQPGTCWRP